MTLEPYDADRLDRLTLRILDIACVLRKISGGLRQEPEADLAIHDKKALEGLARLEDWAQESQARLEMALIKRRGAKKADRL